MSQRPLKHFGEASPLAGVLWGVIASELVALYAAFEQQARGERAERACVRVCVCEREEAGVNAGPYSLDT